MHSLCELTADIREYVRLGRALWPRYLAPVQPNQIAETLASIETAHPSCISSLAETQRHMLSLLHQRISPYIRTALDRGLGFLALDTSGLLADSEPDRTHHDAPILVKYLLLAAFLCHTNRADRDRDLFSIQGNGKRKKRGRSTAAPEDNDGDDSSEASMTATGRRRTNGDQPATLRPRTFPVERLYSLYVSLVSLNASTIGDAAENHDELMLSAGNLLFHETVTYLRDAGILHDYPPLSATDRIPLGQRRFWSTITRDEVDGIAKSIHFPLERYIV